MYWHGRDKLNRPVMIFRMGKISKAMMNDPTRLITSIIFACEWVIRFALVPGRVEGWVQIFDLAGCSLGNMNINSIKKIVSAFSRLYRFRAGKTILLNPPFGAQTVEEKSASENLNHKIKILN